MFAKAGNSFFPPLNEGWYSLRCRVRGQGGTVFPVSAMSGELLPLDFFFPPPLCVCVCGYSYELTQILYLERALRAPRWRWLSRRVSSYQALLSTVLPGWTST